MILDQVQTLQPFSLAPETRSGPVFSIRDYLVYMDGSTYAHQGHTSFLLYDKWLRDQPINDVIDYVKSKRANTVRVLGMVHWGGNPTTAHFGPATPGYYARLRPFVDYLGSQGLRCEFTVFAAAQDILPNESDQRAHLLKVHDLIGSAENVFIEIANEPWQNGCNPVAIWHGTDRRRCPMAYGIYTPLVYQNGPLWYAAVPHLDYLTAHLPRETGWARKAKDLQEYRDGSGDGQQSSPLMEGLHVACWSDEPMGAAEADRLAGRQRSNVPDDFFWHHATAHILGAGSTFHYDGGLVSEVPLPGSDQDRCADAAALAWSLCEPEFQQGHYTRSGLSDLPLIWEERHFPDDQISRIYGRVLGNRAICVAIHPEPDWYPVAAGSWRVVTTAGPQNSLVHLER